MSMSRPARAAGPPRRGIGPRLEALEARDLPSVAPIGLAAVGAGPSPRLGRPAATEARSGGTPTPHERARESFSAAFSGRYTTGPGRFTDQALQTYIQGGGTSSAFLHGDLQMAIVTPADPSEESTGTASLIVKNVESTGNLLVLDLRSDAPPDPQGRPTRLSWTVGEGSGGTFADAEGEGTVEVRYIPGGKLPARALGAGRAMVQFRGRVNVTGTTNILRST